MHNKNQIERKKINSKHQNVRIQKGSSKPNNMKSNNTNNNSSPQKRMIKIDLKLQYLINQLNSNRKFKDYMQDLNMATKDVMMKANHVEQNFVNSCKQEKKKNSFSIVPDIKQKTNSHSKDKIINQSGKSPNGELEKKVQLESKFVAQSISQQKLKEIKQMISEKKNQILSHIKLIKKRMNNSSIWDDKYFYDFTESNYEEKMFQMQQILKITQENLQEKQKQKKESIKDDNNMLIRAKSIRYSLYERNSQNGLMIDQNIEIKHKIMTEIKRINDLQSRLSTILQQKNALQGSNENNNNKESAKQNDHPFLQSVAMLKKEMKIIQAEISAKKKLIEWKDKFHSVSQISSNDSKIIAQQIQLFTRQVLTKELAKTKNKISMLKYQTLNLQNAIKELQGYKALIILRSKNEENIGVNNKKTSFTGNKVFNDEILHQILQHQFLMKSLRLKVETRFCGLMKKNIHSFSDTQISQRMNYFSNVNTLKKSISLKKIKKQKIQKIDLKEYKMKSSAKKNTKLIVTSTKSPKKKETASSAETNS